MEDVDGNQVRLVIPAEPGFLRLARLTAASVASRMGFTFDEVEDLRIAVDELCYFLIGGRSSTGTITVTCGMEAGAITVEGVGDWPDTMARRGAENAAGRGLERRDAEEGAPGAPSKTQASSESQHGGAAGENDVTGGESASPPPPAELPELSRRILSAVVDAYEVQGTERQPCFRIRKRHQEGPLR